MKNRYKHIYSFLIVFITSIALCIEQIFNYSQINRGFKNPVGALNVPINNSLILIIALSVLLFVAYFAIKAQRHLRLNVGLLLILMGGIPNVWQRIFYGYVQDEFSFYNLYFNGADIVIVIGCVWVVFTIIFPKEKTVDKEGF